MNYKKLYCYTFRTSVDGRGKLKSYEIEARETYQSYIAGDDERLFPDYTDRIKKRDLEAIFPIGFERIEYYLVSERPDRDDYFRSEVTNRLINELRQSERYTDKIIKAMQMS